MSAETETMNVETNARPEIASAAERYLEQYGDPLVMNTYLKVTILVLAAVCFRAGGAGPSRVRQRSGQHAPHDRAD